MYVYAGCFQESSPSSTTSKRQVQRFCRLHMWSEEVLGLLEYRNHIPQPESPKERKQKPQKTSARELVSEFSRYNKVGSAIHISTPYTLNPQILPSQKLSFPDLALEEQALLEDARAL